jgi:ribosome-associated protein
MDDKQIVKEILSFLDERKAEKVVALDLHGLSNIADYFVIATGANKPHLKSMYDGLQRLFKDAGFKGYQKNGVPESGWMIMDYQGVMVHIFEQEMRDFYDIEKLWKDAKTVRFDDDAEDGE